MIDFFEKVLKVTYYKNRLIATLGLLISLFFPPIGAAIIGLSLYMNIKAKNAPIMKPDRHEFAFIVASMALVIVYNIINFITVMQNINEIINQSSELIKLII